MSFINNTYFKKIMALIGLLWFVYVIFHMLSLLTFHNGQIIFNNFYHWLNQSIFYYVMIWVLPTVLIFHIFVAVARQLTNNKSRGINYKKSYPKAIPRMIAWSGASILFAFIVLHFIQMKLPEEENLYQQLIDIFTNPLMLIIYAFGLISLGAHLHHGLNNVLQTLGIYTKINNIIVISIVTILILGFISIPLGIIYA